MNPTYVTVDQLNELRADPNVASIHVGRTIDYVEMYPVYPESKPLTIKPETDVLVSRHHDGTYFIHFMSVVPNSFHYKAPWISDDQVTHETEEL